MSATDLRPDSEVTWQELAAVVDALQLTPGHSSTTRRCFVELNGELLWADVEGVRLDPAVPGAGQLQAARLHSFGQQLERERDERHASLAPDELERELATERRLRDMPDPPDWQQTRYEERRYGYLQ